jgi:hypothetical protein
MIRKIKTFSFLFLFLPFSAVMAQIDYVIIRDQPGGGGNEITDVTITADETLTLYAAGYSSATGYDSDVSVDWSTTGTLDSFTHTGSSWTFSPVTVGSGTIVAHHATATDDATGTITVNPGALDSFTLAGLPTSVTAGSSFSGGVTVTAFDSDGNQKTDYTGTVTWSSSDLSATLPTDGGGWTGGQKTFSGSSFVLCTTPSQTITVTDNINSSVSQTSGLITVTPAALGSFTLSGEPSTIQAGQPFGSGIVVTAFDEYGNQKTDYAGRVIWSSTDTHSDVSLPIDDGNDWNNGQKTFSGSSFVLCTTPSQTITATDNTNPSISRESDTIPVTPAALGSFTLSGVPGTIQAGQSFPSPAHDITVTAYDSYNNQKTDYTGTVIWSSTDTHSDVSLPTDDGNWDNGQKTFDGSDFKLCTTSSQATVTVQDGGVSRESGWITVTPAILGSFQLINVRTSVQAGQSFGSPTNDITVIAYDIYNNQKTDYAGILTWLSSDASATLPTDNVSGWTNGQKTFSGSNFRLYTAPSQTISVQHGSVIRTSGVISVSPAAINHFDLSCGTTLYAGLPFQLDVTGAQDSYGNNWSGTVDVSVINGGGDSPSGSSPIINDIQVNNGTGNAYQTLYLAESNVQIQGQANSVTDVVTSITVNPNILASLKIRDTGGNSGNEVGTHSMNVGDHLTLYSAGYDAYGNYRNDANTNWSSSGLTPEVNSTNTSSITFTPTLPGNGTVTATDPSHGISDHTGIITVNPGTVASFGIQFIGSSHRLGYPFTVTITALDNVGNTATSFVGRVLIDDLTGTLHPDTSGYFVNGVWTGGVTVYQEWANDIITVTALSGSPPPTGTSTSFDVIPSPGIEISQFYPVLEDSVTLLSSVTTGQSLDWFLKMVVQNFGSDTVTLDSTKLNFIVGGIKRNDYSIVFPTEFLGSGTRYLAGETTDSVLVQVDTTGNDAGAATVQGFIYLGTRDGGTLVDDTLSTLSVQTPAQPLIYSIYTSQPEVTRGQDSLWSAVIIIRNNGGSTVEVDSSADSTYISFSLGSNWQIERPLTMTGGDWILGGGETDSIVFTVEHTGEGSLGACTIHGRLSGVESNTGRRLIEDTQDGGWGSVTIEEPPFLQITEVTNLAMNAPYVNTGQTFSIRIRVNNNGGDSIHDVELNLFSDGASTFNQPIPPFSLSGYESKMFEVSGIASYVADASEIFTVDATGIAENTNFVHQDESSPDDTTRAVIQNPASLTVMGVYPSKTSVIGGQIDPWVIKVAVRNTGQDQADIQLDKPQSSDLTFLNNGVSQLDYKVDPDTVLKGGGLILEAGSTDTLIYTVRATGRLGGTVTIRATGHGKDKNDNTILVNTAQSSISVQSEQDFRVMSTRIKTLNTTDAGNGYVNTGQSFKVMTIVENGLGQTIPNIQVLLQSSGSSIISNPIKTIPQLVPNSWDSLEFNVTASENENLSGEIFTAMIYQSASHPGPAVDSTAIAFIQNPAQLQVQLSLSSSSGQFSVNQSFTLQASMINQGSARVDSSGRVCIKLPSDYTLLSSADTSAISPGAPAQWSIKTPASVDFEQTDQISVILYQFPYEINTGDLASVEQDSLQIDVTVIQRSLEATVSIPSPLGAGDRELSTDQTFTVRVSVESHHCKNITAEITLPSPWYKTEDDLMKSVISNEVTWQITAPNIAMGSAFISVTTKGEDSLQDGVYIEDTDYLELTCVSKADLYMTLSILSPPDAVEDNIISLGQEFEIGASLENRGDADTVGTAAATLKTLPTGYTTTQSYTKALVNGQASWIIRAPNSATGKAVNIEAELTTIPMDINTNKSCHVSRGSDKVAVTTEGAWLAISMVPLSPSVTSSLVPGQEQVKLMMLQLDNRGVEGASPIRINRISFAVEDLTGLEISPSSVLSNISIVNSVDSTIVYGECIFVPDTNRVDVFLSNARVTWDTNLELTVCGKIPEKDGVSYFQLNIPTGDYIEARDNTSGIMVPVKDITGEDLINLRSDPKHVFNPENEAILWNCPNPFGEPGKTTTDISFYVKEAKETTLRIFTIIGEPVCTKFYTAAELENVVGSIQKWIWDGRNDKGLIVLNGVYYLFLETNGRVIAKTKIAFVK